MITPVLAGLGWLLAVLFTTAVLGSAGRTIRGYFRKPKVWLGWTTPVLFTVPDLAALTGLGILPVVQGAVLAALLFTGYWTMLILGRKRYGAPVRVFRADLRSGWSWLRRDLARARSAALGGLHRKPEAGEEEGPPAAPAAPQPAAWPQAPVRPVPPAAPPGPPSAPSLRDDPNLGEVPNPADIVAGLEEAGVDVPEEWEALAARVAEFHPENDQDLLSHVMGEVAGVLAYSSAWTRGAEILAHDVRLDPAYVAGHHEAAEEVADIASAFSMLSERYGVIYDAVRHWLEEHPDAMPSNAAEWFGDGDSTPETGTGDDGIAA